MHADEVTFHLSQYLTELPLMEYKMLRYAPSTVAAAALYVAMRILKSQVDWEEQLYRFANLHEIELRPCAKDLCVLLQGIDKISLQAVKKKFSMVKFSEVAKIKLESA